MVLKKKYAVHSNDEAIHVVFPDIMKAIIGKIRRKNLSLLLDIKNTNGKVDKTRYIEFIAPTA